MEPVLTEQETSLLQALRRLPPDTAAELTSLAGRLAVVRLNTKIDWSDEDLNEFTMASLRRLGTGETRLFE
jgi:hypothetical protein